MTDTDQILQEVLKLNNTIGVMKGDVEGIKMSQGILHDLIVEEKQSRSARCLEHEKQIAEVRKYAMSEDIAKDLKEMVAAFRNYKGFRTYILVIAGTLATLATIWGVFNTPLKELWKEIKSVLL